MENKASKEYLHICSDLFNSIPLMTRGYDRDHTFTASYLIISYRMCFPVFHNSLSYLRSTFLLCFSIQELWLSCQGQNPIRCTAWPGLTHTPPNSIALQSQSSLKVQDQELPQHSYFDNFYQSLGEIWRNLVGRGDCVNQSRDHWHSKSLLYQHTSAVLSKLKGTYEYTLLHKPFIECCLERKDLPVFHLYCFPQGD